MGVFLQVALFPGCDETSASAAVGVARKAGFAIDPEKCRYAQSYEGTQVLMEGDELGFAPLAKALSDAAVNPVMLLYIYDGDFWGYDFYGGHEEDHFSALPDYFEPITQKKKAPIRQSGGADRMVPHPEYPCGQMLFGPLVRHG